MSRRKNKRRGKRQQPKKRVQKQEVNKFEPEIEMLEEAASAPTVQEAPTPENKLHPLIQKILYTGQYEIVGGNILRKIAGDVGYTINEDFIKKLEDPDYFAKFMPVLTYSPEIADKAYTVMEPSKEEKQAEQEAIELEEPQEEVQPIEEPEQEELVEDVVEVEEEQVGPKPDTLQGDLLEIKTLVDEILNGPDEYELSQEQKEIILKHFAYEKALTLAVEEQVKSENYYFNPKGKELLGKILYHTGNLLIDLENVVYFDD